MINAVLILQSLYAWLETFKSLELYKNKDCRYDLFK